VTIPVAHDYNCGQCWIALHQVRRLQREFGVLIDWLSYELYPQGLEWALPETSPPGEHAVRHKEPHVPRPSRFTLQLFAEGLEPPNPMRPRRMRTFNALQATEYARTEGVQDRFVEVLYRAHWEAAMDINDPSVLRALALGIVQDLDSMEQAVASRRFDHRISRFNDQANGRGVFYLPTFFLDGQLLAEPSYHELASAVREALKRREPPVLG
jgi:predicted DsbA family dithiol-disulfide isomerase